MGIINRRIFLKTSVLVSSPLGITSSRFLWAQRPKRPETANELAEAMRKRLIEQLQGFKPNNNFQPNDAQHVAQIDLINQRYTKQFEADGMKFDALVHSARTFQEQIQSPPVESSRHPPLIIFAAWDPQVVLLGERRVIRCILGIYNPFPLWQNRLYGKVYVGQSHLISSASEAVRAIDSRFPILTEPGVRGETPEVPATGVAPDSRYALMPFPAINTEGTIQQGLVLPPLPISLWEDAPYELPPAFRMLGFTLLIPSGIGSRGIDHRSTNFVGHAVLFKLNPLAVSTVERRFTFVFRA